MGVSKNRGYPLNHPFVHRVFHYSHHPFWDTIIFRNIQIENANDHWLLATVRRLPAGIPKAKGVFFQIPSTGEFSVWASINQTRSKQAEKKTSNQNSYNN